MVKEKALQDWNQRHRENEKEYWPAPRISERRITLPLTSHFSAFTSTNLLSPITSHFSRPRQRPAGALPGSLPYTVSMRRSWAAFDNGDLQNCARLEEEDTWQRI
jgi:hypothetical protein